jgi:hypothetical protein
MPADYSAQPEREDGLLSAHPQEAVATTGEALDAIVYDVHPALAYPSAYPYASRPPQQGPLPGEHPTWHIPPQMLVWWSSLASLQINSPTPAQYVVPRRFGMSAILGIITALSLLFGWFHWSNAPVWLYLFFGVQSLLICLAQMLYGQTPRAASSIAGAIILPIFIIAVAIFAGRGVSGELVCMLFTSVPIGAFLGYLTGTMAAGVFLVMDAADAYFTGTRNITHSPSSSTIASAS